MPGLGLITNPHSRANQRDPTLALRLGQALGDGGVVAKPDGLPALRDLLDRWRDSGLHTLAIHGGDGTAHRVVTAMVESWGEAPLPKVALLPGGTMNIIANSLGQRGQPFQLARRLVTDGPSLPVMPTWAMRIEGSTGVQYGFLFGNGIIGRFLERYYEGGAATPAKAARILARGATSALVGGAYARSLRRPFLGRVLVDGQDWGQGPWTAIAAGTVEQLGLGFRAFHLAPQNPGRLHAIAIGSSIIDLARDLPRVYRGKPLARPGNRGVAAQQIELTSSERIGFMIDGDFHTSDHRLLVGLGPCLQVIDLR
jgi:diacylglycerol kinase family enzyme